MSDPQHPDPAAPDTRARDVAEAVIARAPQDVVFVIRFIGGSQAMLHDHFRAFIEAELTRVGATTERFPMLPFFVDSHARELRDFVFTGVALDRPFRLPEMEALTGDVGLMMRVDLWDSVASHIVAAQQRFLSGLEAAVATLETAENQLRGQGGAT